MQGPALKPAGSLPAESGLSPSVVGQTLKSIRDWLEAEGMPLRYSQLTLYVRQIRLKQAQGSEAPSQPRQDQFTQMPEPVHPASFRR